MFYYHSYYLTGLPFEAQSFWVSESYDSLRDENYNQFREKLTFLNVNWFETLLIKWIIKRNSYFCNKKS